MKLIAALCLLALSFTARSQKLKISGGISYSKLNWKTTGPDNRYFEKPYLGYTAGIGIEYLRLGIVNLSSNIEYLRKGGIDTIYYTDAMGNNLFQKEEAVIFNFVNANTYAKIKIPTGGKLRPFISLGVYAGFMVSANKLAGDIGEYKRFNTGAVTGIGAGYKILGRQIGLEIQYLPSFTPLFDKPTATGSTKKVTDRTVTAKAFFIL
ncbi:MAG: hypothetical protein JNM14_16290 [Ferruginibacter sp.]|nr:hypothetical protein [Ferruginibacter sp.]